MNVLPAVRNHREHRSRSKRANHIVSYHRDKWFKCYVEICRPTRKARHKHHMACDVFKWLKIKHAICLRKINRDKEKNYKLT